MKKLSFNKVGLLIRNNYVINRSIPLILFIVVFALSCIIGAMPVSDVESRYDNSFVKDLQNYENYVRNMEGTYDDLIGIDSVFSGVFIVVSLILSFLAPLSLNSFMRDRSGNDFYHSLSVTRGEIFLANYITAFVNTAVTVIISQLSGLLLMDIIADYKPMTLVEMIAEQLPIIATILLFTALFTAIAMIATVGAGTVFASVINYAFINFYIPATVLAIAVSGGQLFDSNLMEWLDHFPQVYAYTSPFIRYVFAGSGMMELTSVTYILLAVSTLVLIAFGIWLYSVKKNENGQKPLPFAKTVRPMQYLICFDAILLGCTFFEAVSGSFIWFVIGGLLALFFSFIIFNAFADKSFHGVFKRSRHMAFILIATILLGIVFVADVFQIYKEPVPNADEINYAYVHVSLGYPDREEWLSYEFNEEIEDYNKGYAIPITDENQKDLAKLWSYLNENESGRYYTDEKQEYVSVSMGISCDNDYARYHAYSYVYSGDPKFDEIKAIVEGFEEKYKSWDTNVSYYAKEEIKAVSIPEPLPEVEDVSDAEPLPA